MANVDVRDVRPQQTQRAPLRHHPGVGFPKPAYDSLGTEQGFLEMRKRVTTVMEAFEAGRARAKQMQGPP